MRSKGVHRICLVSILVAFFWCVSTAEEEYTCPYSIHVNKGQIIKARESVSNGASFLKHSYVKDAKECYKLCCERKNCDLAQMQYKNSTVGFFPQIEKICYMFYCGEPSKCRFGVHDHYATIAYDRPDEDLSHLGNNQYETPSVKVGKPKWNSAKESQYKPSVTQGYDEDEDVKAQPNKPSFRQHVKEQEHNQEDKDLTSSWKPRHEEENAENSKKVKEFGKPTYHTKDTKELSKTVKEEGISSEKSKESEEPFYPEVVTKHLEASTEHVQVKTKKPITVPVQKFTHKQTVQKPKQEDIDDVDADLERKLEELTPSNNYPQEPAGHSVKVIPTEKPTTFHHWRQFVDNNPDFPYTIPVKVKEPTVEPIAKEWHKPSTERRTTTKTTTMQQPVRTEPPKRTEKPTTEKPATQKPMTREEPHSNLPILEVPIRSKNISDVVVIETHRLKIIENKAVLPLAIFLVLAILLLFVVALRLRIVKSKLKRRPFATDDADYLINGMYL